MNTTPAKRITVIAERLLEDRLVRDIKSCGATGYTITDARGQGSRGTRTSEWEGGNIKLETLVNERVADGILELLNEKYFQHYAVIAYMEDVAVVRGEKYL
jgi:nitrogen regulatory protein P-II 2